MRIGFHASRQGLPSTIQDHGITTSQIFLGSPRSWKKPLPPSAEEAKAIAATGATVYVHSGYLLNPASANPLVREKTRKALQEEFANAAALGAQGLIVHSGQGGPQATPQEALQRWQEVLKGLTFEVPLLLENTAGGQAAPGRAIGPFKELFMAMKSLGPTGYCLDTCHAWAGELALKDLHERLLATLGEGPSLVHLNGSSDPAGSGRDHHANIDLKTVQGKEAFTYCLEAKAPVILETPGGPGGSADLALVKERLLPLT